MPRYFLTEEDVLLLRNLANQVRNDRRNTTNRPGPLPAITQATETYMALTPEDGIDAMVPASSTEFGEGDKPGYADCEIYKINENTSPPSLTKVSGTTKRVYNMSLVAIDGGQWIQITKDKFGNWYISGGGGGADGCCMRWMRIVSLEADLSGTGTGGGDYGYLAYLLQNQSNIPGGVLGDDLTESAVYIVFIGSSALDPYTPIQEDIDDRTPFLGKYEGLAPDGRRVYSAEGGVTLELECDDGGTGAPTYFRWLAGRLVQAD